MLNQEKEKIQKAGNAAGKYLEKLNKFDVAKLSKEEWDNFIEIICTEYFLPF